jgi:acetyl-CoA acetyltransferase
MSHMLSYGTGVHAHDIDVIELHDCFSCNELITYEALGLCAEGKAGVVMRVRVCGSMFIFMAAPTAVFFIVLI